MLKLTWRSRMKSAKACTCWTCGRRSSAELACLDEWEDSNVNERGADLPWTCVLTRWTVETNDAPSHHVWRTPAGETLCETLEERSETLKHVGRRFLNDLLWTATIWTFCVDESAWYIVVTREFVIYCILASVIVIFSVRGLSFGVIVLVEKPKSLWDV